MSKITAISVSDEVAGGYDRWYDSKEGRPVYRSELRCVKPMVSARRPLLEIGVGTGRFSMHFRGAIGVDISFNALTIAKKRGIKAISARAERLPLRNRFFKQVIIILTLCFVRSPSVVLKEAKRVLAKDGRLIIGFIPRDSAWGVLYEEKKKMGHSIYSGANFYTFGEVAGFLEKIGFKILRVRCTLLRGPHEPRRIERPLEGYLKGCGFVCIEAGRR